jgi:hypothetical protein
MNPTQYELATLAAMQSGTPRQRAQAALALWRACGEVMEQQKEIDAVSKAGEAERADWLAVYADQDAIPMERLLREVMPHSKPEDRVAKYRAWIRHAIAYHDGLTGDELDTAAQAAITRDRGSGIPLQNAAAIATSFSKFLDADRRAKNTERAKKGAAAKKNLCGVSKPSKTPQAKRKPRQAKE